MNISPWMWSTSTWGRKPSLLLGKIWWKMFSKALVPNPRRLMPPRDDDLQPEVTRDPVWGGSGDGGWWDGDKGRRWGWRKLFFFVGWEFVLVDVDGEWRNQEINFEGIFYSPPKDSEELSSKIRYELFVSCWVLTYDQLRRRMEKKWWFDVKIDLFGADSTMKNKVRVIHICIYIYIYIYYIILYYIILYYIILYILYIYIYVLYITYIYIYYIYYIWSRHIHT